MHEHQPIADTRGNRRIVCADCGAFFVFTAGEQAFYWARNLADPRRCIACRQARRAEAGRQEERAGCRPPQARVGRDRASRAGDRVGAREAWYER